MVKKIIESKPDTRKHIEMRNPHASLHEVMEDNDYDLTIATVVKIMEAIDKELDRIDVAVITYNRKEYYNIGFGSSVYLTILENNFDKLISFEEYNLLIEVNKYINKLKKSINIFGEVN